jgi:hypothetical protein
MNDQVLKLRADVVYVAVDDGVWIRTNRGSFTLRGASMAQWIERLAPLLDTGVRPEKLASQLDAAQARFVSRLLAVLRERGVVVEVPPGPTAPLDEALRQRFAQQLAYLEHYTADPGAALLRARNTPLGVYGPGRACAALVRALADSGLAMLSLAPTDDVQSARLAADQAMSRLAAAGAPLTIEVTPGLEPDKLVQPVLVALADGNGLALQRAAFGRGASAWLAEVIGDAILIKGNIAGTGPCWECALRRGVYEPAGRPSPERLGAPALAMTTAILAQDVFRFLTGVPGAATVDEAAVLDLAKLSIWRNQVPRHPRCATCAAHPAPAGDGAAAGHAPGGLRPPDAPPERSQSLAPFHPMLGGRCFGVLPSLGPEELLQLPLACCVARFKPAQQSGLVAVGQPVAATDLEYAGAWEQALRYGLEEYVRTLEETPGQPGVAASFPGAVLRALVRWELASWHDGEPLADAVPLDAVPLSDRARWYQSCLETLAGGGSLVSGGHGRALARAEVQAGDGSVLARAAHLDPAIAAESALAAAVASAANAGSPILPPIQEPAGPGTELLADLQARLGQAGLRAITAFPDPVIGDAGQCVALVVADHS